MAAAFMCRRYILNDDELSATFDLLDMDKDGRLNRAEIAALLRTVNVEPTRHELDFIFEEMDTQHTGQIDKATFIRYMRRPPIHRFSVSELEAYFNQVDGDADGAITKDELVEILDKTADLKDEYIVGELFRKADQQDSGRLNFRQFLQIMRD